MGRVEHANRTSAAGAGNRKLRRGGPARAGRATHVLGSLRANVATRARGARARVRAAIRGCVFGWYLSFPGYAARRAVCGRVGGQRSGGVEAREREEGGGHCCARGIPLHSGAVCLFRAGDAAGAGGTNERRDNAAPSRSEVKGAVGAIFDRSGPQARVPIHRIAQEGASSNVNSPALDATRAALAAAGSRETLHSVPSRSTVTVYRAPGGSDATTWRRAAAGAR